MLLTHVNADSAPEGDDSIQQSFSEPLQAMIVHKLTVPKIPDMPPDGECRDRVHQAVDRAYHELVEEVPQPDLLQHLCRRLAEAIELPLVVLVRRHESGMLELEAASRETQLWAELTRLPERWDGTIAGHGPAARALHTQAPVRMDVRDEGFVPWREAARRDGITVACALPLDTSEGAWVLLLFGSAIHARESASLGHGEVTAAAATGCSRLIEASVRLQRQRLLAAALQNAGNAAFIANTEGAIVWSNASFSRLTGYASEEIRGRNPRFLSSGRHGVRYYRDLWNTIRTGRVWRGETVDRDRSGSSFTTIQTITPFGVEGRVTHYAAIYDDISRQKEEQARRELRTGLDPLTGLMHRAALEAAICEELAQSRPVRIAMLSLRKLPMLEHQGAEVVDAVMGECEARIRTVIGADRVARIAVGEYLLHLPDDGKESDELTAALKRELAEPYPLVGKVEGLEPLLGCAESPRDGSTLQSLVHHADRAIGAEPLMPARREFAGGAD